MGKHPWRLSDCQVSSQVGAVGVKASLSYLLFQGYLLSPSFSPVTATLPSVSGVVDVCGVAFCSRQTVLPTPFTCLGLARVMWPLSAILFSVTGDNCWLVCMSQSVNHFYLFLLIDFFLSYQSRIIEENAISSSSFITSSLNVSVKDNPVVSKFTDKGVLVCTETHTCFRKTLVLQYKNILEWLW